MRDTQTNWNRFKVVFRDTEHAQRIFEILNANIGRGRDNWHINKGGTLQSAKYREVSRTIKVRASYENIDALATQIALV